MRCDVLVGGTDKRYNRAFVEFLVKSNLNQFNITLAEAADDILAAVLSDGFDLYLVEEAHYLSFYERLSGEKNLKVMILTEAMTSVDTQKVRAILKYQKIPNIEALMVHHATALTTDEMVIGACKKSRIVSFYSPIGGVGTSTLAQIFAQVKSARGYKVLFVSFEHFQAYETFFHSPQSNNMSDYMVYMLSHTNWLLGLENMISVDVATGICYLKPVLHGKDLAEFDWSIWHQWLAYIAEMSDYEYIVVDVGNHLFEGGMKVLEMSQYRVYLTANDRVAEKKWQTFMHQMQQVSGDMLLKQQSVFCSQRMNRDRAVTNEYDALLTYDGSLYKTGKEGRLHLDPHGTVYRQVEEFLGHV